VKRVEEAQKGALWPLLKLMAARHPWLTATCGLLLVLTGVLPSLFTLASGAMVGSLPGTVQGGFESPDGRRLLLALGVAVGLFVLQQGIGSVASTLAYGMGERVTGHLKRRVMGNVLAPAGISHLEDPDVLTRVAAAQSVGTGQFTPRHAVIGILAVWGPRVSALGSAILLATFRWWLALVLMAAWVVMYRIIFGAFARQISAMMKEGDILRRANYMANLGLTPGAAKETRVFGLREFLGLRYVTEWFESMKPLMAERGKRPWLLPLVCVGIGAVTSFGFVVVGRAGLAGELTLGQLAVYLGAVGGMGALGSLSGQHLEMGWGLASVKEALDLERALGESLGPVESGHESPAGLPFNDITFENVSFEYSGGAQVFDGLDLRIEAGKSLAVVGENGAGKTTLVKLLARLYEPSGGRITVDGRPLTNFRVTDWQRRVAAIFQDFVRYELTASENVVLGNLDLLDDLGARDEAAAQAGAAETVAGLSNGWDTVLSRQAKDGTDLSGGQWQRIALARALFAVRGGAGVLVLDEPTANLDVRAEADLYDRFLELTRGVTTIVISHRFSTVRRADRIVVLEGGRVVEDGAHEDLLAAGGRYATMFRLQAARFTDDPEGDDSEAGLEHSDGAPEAILR
jgi:ATP-binding cassette, subfamily B, bacterial